MERKRKKINVKFIVLILSLVIFLSMSIFTFAYFTDNKNYTGTLNFGELKLKVSGDSVTENSKTLSFDTARKLNNDSTWTGKYMPGDTINIKLKVGLEDGSEPAYYLVQISDNKNVFENAYYYSQDGTNIYVNNGQKIYKQGTTTAVTTPIIGKILSAGDSNAHSLTISAKISENFEEQGVIAAVECKIYAIQIANLTEKDAFDLLDKEINPQIVTFLEGWREVITNYESLTSIGFYYKNDKTSLTGFAKDDTLTAKFNDYMEESDKGKIEVWKKSSTDIAYVSDYEIYAVGCALFAECASLTKLNLTNFNTTNLVTMGEMFSGCSSLTELDLSKFNTANVEEMSAMFENCSSLTTVDLSSFNTAKVDNLAAMFSGCSSLTTLDLSSFDTTNVVVMYRMFEDCTKLTSLNISNFNTQNVWAMDEMFSGCSSLTTLDLSNFNTTKLTVVSSMFKNCSSLTKLDLSSFITTKVYAWNAKDENEGFNAEDSGMFYGTFSKSPSTSTLIISENFVYGATKTTTGSTQFTKATLNSKAGFNTSVTLKRGTEIVS